jgi:hypothetical protein
VDEAAETTGTRTHVEIDGRRRLLSTQENLWLLLAFTSMIGAETTPELHPGQPAAAVVSKNGRSAAWVDHKMENDLVIKGLNQSALTFLMQAEYSTSEVDTDRVDRGFRIERVVKNLTDATRVGTPNAPLKLGDQLLITYRLNTRKASEFCGAGGCVTGGRRSGEPEPCAHWKILPAAAARSAGSFAWLIVLRDARSLGPSLF